ncbi:putative ribonuclease H-like domain-containing protein [Tanacetum coccineum]
MTPRAVLLKTSLTPFNTVKPVNTAHPKPVDHSAKSMLHFSKQAQSTAQRPFYKQTTLTSRYVNIAMRHYHTERPRAGNTVRSYTGPVNAVRAKRVNDVKTSACWVWRPTKPNGASLAFKRHNYIDARGRSKSWMLKAHDWEHSLSLMNLHVYKENLMQDVGHGEPKSAADDQMQVEDGPDNENDEKDKSEYDSSPKEVNTAEQHVNTASPEVNTGRFKLNTVDPSVNTTSSNDQDSPKDMFKIGASHTLETTHVEFFSDEDKPEVDLGNILNSYTVPTTPNTRIHKDHPIKNVIGDVKSSVQTRRMTKPTSEQGFLNAIYKEKSHDTLNTCLYACFLSQIEPTSIAKALSDSSWSAIGTKWVFRNKKNERGIVIRNKSRLVAQGHRQEKGIDYEEVFAPVARIEAIRLFLAYASFMGFLVYQMDVKSAFLYGTIEEEVYVTQPPSFKDPNNPNKVTRRKIDQTLFIKKQKGDILLVQVYVDDIIFGSTNKELCIGFVKLMKDKFQMSSLGELTFFLGLQVPQKEDGVLSARINIFQVTPKTSHVLAVNRNFKNLKGKPTLGLWYSRDSLFELVAYTDSDYAGATQDRKSKTGGYLLTKGFDAGRFQY